MDMRVRKRMVIPKSVQKRNVPEDKYIMGGLIEVQQLSFRDS